MGGLQVRKHWIKYSACDRCHDAHPHQLLSPWRQCFSQKIFCLRTLYKNVYSPHMSAVGSIFSSTVLDLGLCEMRTIEAENLVSGLGSCTRDRKGERITLWQQLLPSPWPEGWDGQVGGGAAAYGAGGRGQSWATLGNLSWLVVWGFLGVSRGFEGRW